MPVYVHTLFKHVYDARVSAPKTINALGTLRGSNHSIIVQDVSFENVMFREMSICIRALHRLDS